MYDREGLGVKTVTYMDNQDCIGKHLPSACFCHEKNEGNESVSIFCMILKLFFVNHTKANRMEENERSMSNVEQLLCRSELNSCILIQMH